MKLSFDNQDEFLRNSTMYCIILQF